MAEALATSFLSGLTERPSFGGFATLSCGLLLMLVGAGQLLWSHESMTPATTPGGLSGSSPAMQPNLAPHVQASQPIVDGVPVSGWPLVAAPRDSFDAVRDEVRIPAIGLIVVGGLLCLSGFLPAALLAVYWLKADMPDFGPQEATIEAFESSPIPRIMTPSPQGESVAPPLVEPQVDPIVNPHEAAARHAGAPLSSLLVAQAASGQYDDDPPPRAGRNHVLIWFSVFILGGAAILAILSVPLGIFIAWSGWKMLHLQSHGLAMTAAVLSMIPCHPVFWLGLIFGIWALAVLGRPHVKEAFDQVAMQA